MDDLTTTSSNGKASKMIRYYSLLSAGAGVLSPPVLDLAAVTAIQLRMVRRLAGLYGKESQLDDEGGRALVAALTGALAPAFAGRTGAAWLVKMIGPGMIGTLAAGATIPTLNYGTTTLVGKFFEGHFQKAGSEKANLSELSQHVAKAIAR
jgi:uncharacterized protein (DUF697 family)